MRLAITGSSSTGKTTLAKLLVEAPRIGDILRRFISADARSLLTELGHKSMDRMSRAELREFQLAYFERKKLVEDDLSHFVTDRSFVDVAAYWLERDTFDQSRAERERLLEPCRQLADRYDLHVYLPFGLLPFRDDGYRSNDMMLHRRIDARIRLLLNEWNLRHVTLETTVLDERVTLVSNQMMVHK